MTEANGREIQARHTGAVFFEKVTIVIARAMRM